MEYCDGVSGIKSSYYETNSVGVKGKGNRQGLDQSEKWRRSRWQPWFWETM